MDYSDQDLSLQDLLAEFDKIAKKRYHRLTNEDFSNYRKFDYWRYVNGDYECGTTDVSKQWVKANSNYKCPVCNRPYINQNGKTIDHKLPRSQYPWLSMIFENLWVICKSCNQEKAEKHWYEYERYIFLTYPERYPMIELNRPKELLDSLKNI